MYEVPKQQYSLTEDHEEGECGFDTVRDLYRYDFRRTYSVDYSIESTKHSYPDMAWHTRTLGAVRAPVLD